MKGFGSICRYELKKILSQKTLWVAVIVLLYWSITCGVRTPSGSYAEYLQTNKAAQLSITGEKIDDEMLEKLHALMQQGTIIESGYNDVDLYVSSFLTRNNGEFEIPENYGGESALYEARSSWVHSTWRVQELTDEEIAYWQNYEKKLDTPFTYPPLLTAELGGQVTRIILAFDVYYDHHDFTEFAAEAKNNHWNCLAISLPHLDDGCSITADDLSNYIDGIYRNKSWIFHTSADKALTRLKQNASAPARVRINYGETVYACPLHKRELSGTFYAREQDCADCEFNLVLSPVCLCMAKTYVKSLADLDTPIEERTKKFLAHRKANEDALAKQRSVKETAPQPSNGPYPQSQQQTQQFHKIATGVKQNLPVDALCDEYRNPLRRKKCDTQQILRENYEQEDYIIFDSGGHQWMKCVRCGWPVTKKEVAKHITCNKGICTECLARESDEM